MIRRDLSPTITPSQTIHLLAAAIMIDADRYNHDYRLSIANFDALVDRPQ
jgi:hypothetical protein